MFGPMMYAGANLSYFNSLFEALHSCGMPVFIIGPLHTLNFGAKRFSSNSTPGFDNFNLSWNRPCFYRYDRLHPSKEGSYMLAANLQHTIQTTPLAHA